MSQIDNFFESPKEHSIVKSDIVSEYFGAWVDIMKTRCKELTYLDLFSGPGMYEDGTPSTPVKIFEVVETKKIYENLKTYFYERDKGLGIKLENALKNHKVFKELRTKPEFSEREISREIIDELPINDCTLSFVDPHGYDLSANLLVTLIRNWGSDCIFYFTTSGIKRNIENASEEVDMMEIFGKKGLEELRSKLELEENWVEKDQLMLKALESKVLEIRGRPLYFLPFAMQFDDKRLTSYYLILITKHHLGFKMMKDIMSKGSRCFLDADEIPHYYYSKIEHEKGMQLELHLEKKTNRMEMLKEKLLKDFKGRELKVKYVVDDCHRKGYFETTSNIIDAMLRLELEPKPRLKVDSPQDKRPLRKGKPTLGEDRVVTFLN